MPDVRVTGLEDVLANLDGMKESVQKRLLGKGTKAAITIIGADVKRRSPGRLKNAAGIKTEVRGKVATSTFGYGKLGYLAVWLEWGHRIVGHKKYVKDQGGKLLYKLPGKDTGKRAKAMGFMRAAFDTKIEKALSAFAAVIEEGVASMKMRAAKKAARLASK